MQENLLTVISFRKGAKPISEHATLVDVSRRNPILGNKFPMKDQSETERLRVVEAFRHSLLDDFRRKGAIFQACVELAKRVSAGEEIALGCWCAPKACHADVIKKAVLYLVSPEGRVLWEHVA